jgi:transmembrane sensor
VIHDADWARLARYYAGECSLEEADETRRWLDEDPARAREADELRALWAASGVSAASVDTDLAWSRLAARMAQVERQAPIGLHRTGEHSAVRFHWTHSSSGLRRAVLAAAAGVVLMAGGVLFERRTDNSPTAPGSRDASLAERIFRTERGQRAVINLADGTRVELGAESVLRVRPFDVGARELFLTGQAVFDVVHDSLRPFLVHAANAVTEDIGTRFSVRAYPGESSVQVLVASGSVALRAAGAPASTGTLLGPSDMGLLDSIGRATVRGGVDSTRYLAWTRDRLVFDNAPLGDVLAEIERWFDVKIDLRARDAARRRVTMNVPTRSMSEVLGAATAPLGLRFSVTDRSVVIR